MIHASCNPPVLSVSGAGFTKPSAADQLVKEEEGEEEEGAPPHTLRAHTPRPHTLSSLPYNEPFQEQASLFFLGRSSQSRS